MKLTNLLAVVFIIGLAISCSSEDEEVIIETEKRTFYMGVTPWPGDFTVAEVDTAYACHCGTRVPVRNV